MCRRSCAVRRIRAASASLLLNLELAATVLLAAVVFREHLGARLVLAATVVTASGAVLVWEPGSAVDLGGLLVVAACLCWGLDNGVTAVIDQIRPEQVTLMKGVVAHEHEHHHPALEHEHEHEHTHDDGHHDHSHRDGFTGRHSHRHRHEELTHAHGHVPDLHHRHPH